MKKTIILLFIIVYSKSIYSQQFESFCAINLGINTAKIIEGESPTIASPGSYKAQSLGFASNISLYFISKKNTNLGIKVLGGFYTLKYAKNYGPLDLTLESSYRLNAMLTVGPAIFIHTKPITIGIEPSVGYITATNANVSSGDGDYEEIRKYSGTTPKFGYDIGLGFYKKLSSSALLSLNISYFKGKSKSSVSLTSSGPNGIYRRYSATDFERKQDGLKITLGIGGFLTKTSDDLR